MKIALDSAPEPIVRFLVDEVWDSDTATEESGDDVLVGSLCQRREGVDVDAHRSSRNMRPVRENARVEVVIMVLARCRRGTL